ncbi:MAG: hypothetical protein ISS14_04835 [Actinobacteria bacterium]|nr:hypothetical protein [Actinomycetota bacterium]MBL7124196.1 hypothetical protein [Actinomycetota bacterium]
MENDSEEEKLLRSFYRRRRVGITFRIVFILYAIYAVFVNAFYSFVLKEYGWMVLKIIIFPYTIVVAPLIAVFTGAFHWYWILIWLGGLGSYAISTFYGRLKPID